MLSIRDPWTGTAAERAYRYLEAAVEMVATIADARVLDPTAYPLEGEGYVETAAELVFEYLLAAGFTPDGGDDLMGRIRDGWGRSS